MEIVTGCTILRDAKGNPGKMIIHRRMASEKEADKYCEMVYRAVEKAERIARIKKGGSQHGEQDGEQNLQGNH